MSKQFRVRKANYKNFMEEKYYVEYKRLGFWWAWSHNNEYYGKYFFDTPEEAESCFRKYRQPDPPDEIVSIHTTEEGASDE